MSKLLVFGHLNPDTDAIGAAIAYANFLNQIGEEAEAVALGTPNDETRFALEHFNISVPRVIEQAAPEVERVALVDHNEFAQSVADIRDVQIDYVVDHHRIANFETAGPLYYRAEPIGSTSSVLFKLYQEKGIEIPADVAGMMLSAIISDTLLFKSPTCTPEDVKIAQQLAEIAQVDVNEYGIQMLKAGADVSARSAMDIVDGDAKTFDMNGHKVRIGQVNTVGFVDILKRKAEFLDVMQSELSKHDYAIFLLVITDILENDSIGLVVGGDTTPVTKAFDQAITDNQLNLPQIVSRKKQVVPPLTDAYMS